MAVPVAKLRCQHTGCDAMFTEDDNPEDACHFHPGPPVFHDGGKEWSCCKQKSHDFTMFLELPGCKTGKHSSERPQPKAAPVPKTAPTPVTKLESVAGATNCSRCRQGFFCSDHGSKLPMKVVPPSHKKATVPAAVPVSKVVDLNSQQTCKNKGCGKTFTEKENTDASCLYHPGPAVFRDRMRGWDCCDVHVKDFDEFLEVPPCTRGWHNGNPEENKTRVE